MRDHPYAGFISRVKKPAQYLGGESGEVRKDWSAASGRMCLAFPDLYEVLGAPRDADPDELRAAYHERARELHPDVSTDPEAEERFREVSHAYSVLSKPRSRLTLYGPSTMAWSTQAAGHDRMTARQSPA